MNAIAPAATPPRVHVSTRQDDAWPRRACWFALAFLHLTACTFFGLFTVVYTQLSEQAFGSNTFLYDLILGYRYLPAIGGVYAALGVLHLLLLTRMIQASVTRRQLTFKLPSRSFSSSRKMSALRLAVETIRTTPVSLRIRRWLRKTRRVIALPIEKLIGRHGLIGVDGPYFDHFFVMRELVQVVLQTAQLYAMARLLSKAWLLHVYVAIVCTNCWSSQILRILSARNQTPHAAPSGAERRRWRLYALLIDASLDNITALFMPLVVVVPYVAAYDQTLRSFPLPVWGDDLWVMQVAADIQLLFVVSWVDFAMKLVFALLVLITSHSIHDLCHDQIDIMASAVSPPILIGNGLQKTEAVAARFSTRLAQIRVLVYTLLLSWGVGLVGIHTYASSRALVGGCLVPVRPWFYQHASCAVFHFDCHLRGSSGIRLDTHEALTELSPGAAVYVIFRHCRALAIPSNIQSFQNLIGIKMYNVTLVEWSAEAAVRGDLHRSLRLITMVRVTFPNQGDGLPDGLTHAKFPPTVADVNICVSNLKRLPPDLNTKWPRGLSLLLEHSRFDSFPEVVTRMDVSAISLNGNRLTSVPVDKLLLPSRRLRILSVGGNPLVDVGHNISKVALPPAFYWLIIDSNQLASLPPWLMNDPSVITRMWLIASDTPVCDEIQRQRSQSTASGSAALAPGGFYWQQFVDCTPYPPPMRSLFRLFTEDARSGLDATRIGDRELVELP